MSNGVPQYALRAECRGHDEDVRAIAVCGSNTFATSSRDKTVRVWNEQPGQPPFTTSTVCVGHTSFVSALTWLPPGILGVCPDGAIVSGSRDKSIKVWDSAGNVVMDLKGHELDVRPKTRPNRHPFLLGSFIYDPVSRSRCPFRETACYKLPRLVEPYWPACVRATCAQHVRT